MAPGDFEERVRLVIETIGADKVIKDMNRVNAALMTQEQFKKKHAGFSPDDVSKETARQKKNTEEIKRANMALKERRKLLASMKNLGYKGTGIGMTNAQLSKMDTKMKSLSKTARTFKMHWLGIMFAGMAVDRVMKRLIQGMLKDYKELTKAAITPLSESLTRLEANWKFLKFAIMEASAPFLIRMTDWLGKLAMSLAKSDPDKLKRWGAAILVVAAAAKVFMVGGQFALAAVSLKAFFADFKLNQAKKVNSEISILGKNFSKLAMAKAAIGAGLIIYGAFQFVKSLSSKTPATFGEILSASLTTGIGVGLVTSAAGISALGAAGVGVIAAGVVAIVLATDSKAKKNAMADLEDFFLDARELGFTEADLISGRFFKTFGEDIANIKIQEQGFKGSFLSILKSDTRQINKALEEAVEYYNIIMSDTRLTEEEKIIKLEDYLGIDLPAAKVIGEEVAEAVIEPSILATQALVDKIALDGGDAFTVELTEAVGTFLNDEESGMAALINKATELNDTLGKDVKKTVTINYKTRGGVSESNYGSLV